MNYIEDTLTDILEQHANPQKAAEMSQYMRNLHIYYGIPRPLLEEITKPVLKELKAADPDLKLIHILWNKPQREYQYFSLAYLIASKKHWPESIIYDLEQFITIRSWWDTVDTLAVKLAGEYFKKWPQNIHTIISSWNKSGNMWLNRAAILFQLKYKSKTDEQLLYNIIMQHLHSNEFFIQKAIGWALREYNYTNNPSVKTFIASVELKPLSKREAMKKMDLSSE
jgi:3-methyladenine DNA glycosylase AlkD